MSKVLLVEDDNNLREIFEMRLKAEGYDTITAGNGEEALVVAMKERPDLIIADVMMPKLSGFEMLETLRAAPEMANTKAIMMTALGQPEDRARGERLGVIKYLVKSQVTLEDFVKVVHDVLSADNTEMGATPAAAPAAAAEPAPGNTQLQNNQESEQSMQDDTTNPQAPQADTGATNNDTTNPMSAAPSDAATPDQQSIAQEESAVQSQIDSFVDNTSPTLASDAAAQSNVTDVTGSDAGSPGAVAAPTMAPAGDAGAPATDAGSAPAVDTSAPAATDTGAQPDVPVATPPADPAPQPPTETGPAQQ